jgi:nitrite reductase (NADH) large subunit
MRYIIIGGSAAGISYYIAGAITKEELHFRPLEFFSENKVNAHLGQRVERVLPESKSIRMEDGREYPFDRLLIATGSSPKILDIPGKDKRGVVVIRNIDHAQEIVNRLEEIKTACVLGGGLIGLRTGYALSVRGVKVKIIVKSSHVLSQMLDRDAAEMIQGTMREHGIDIRTGRDAVEIVGKESVEGIILDDGERINCQLVVIGKGVQPNVDFISSTQIKVNEGIVGDETMRTNLPDIYVAGDVAETFDLSTGRTGVNAIWPCAFEQGRVAGLNMAGKKAKYDGSFRMNSLDFYGLPVISMGITRIDGNEFQQFQRKTNSTYRKLVLKEGRIVGAILVGRIQKAGILTTLLKKRVNVSDVIPLLMSDRLNFAELLPFTKQNRDRFTEVEYRELSQRPLASRN